mgnify:CR=1 FL=1
MNAWKLPYLYSNWKALDATPSNVRYLFDDHQFVAAATGYAQSSTQFSRALSAERLMLCFCRRSFSFASVVRYIAGDVWSFSERARTRHRMPSVCSRVVS